MSIIYADTFSNRSGTASVQTSVIETRALPGTKNVSQITDGVLEVSPEDGRYITLEGHGEDNFTIQGFGSAAPVGWSISLIIPRTIGNTGGSSNTLGNYVEFPHEASGSGLDNEKVKILSDGAVYRGYRAYPNATDVDGGHAALFENLTYQHIGGGRWVLREVPASAHGNNANGSWTRDAIGTQRAWSFELPPVAPDTATGQIWRSSDLSEWTFPVIFSTGVSVSPGGATSSTRWLSVVSTQSSATASVSLRLLSSVESASSSAISASVTGRWKPIV